MTDLQHAKAEAQWVAWVLGQYLRCYCTTIADAQKLAHDPKSWKSIGISFNSEAWMKWVQEGEQLAAYRMACGLAWREFEDICRSEKLDPEDYLPRGYVRRGRVLADDLDLPDSQDLQDLIKSFRSTLQAHLEAARAGKTLQAIPCDQM